MSHGHNRRNSWYCDRECQEIHCHLGKSMWNMKLFGSISNPRKQGLNKPLTTSLFHEVLIDIVTDVGVLKDHRRHESLSVDSSLYRMRKRHIQGQVPCTCR